MRTFSSLVFLVLSTTRVAAAQSTRPHQWAQLFATASEAIDLDTATLQRTDGLRRVWLRWDLDRSGPVFLAQYQLEHREVDCARGLTRVLAVETHARKASPHLPNDVLTPAASRPPDTVSSSDSVWHAVSSGSLADIVVKAVCRWREAGA